MSPARMSTSGPWSPYQTPVGRPRWSGASNGASAGGSAAAPRRRGRRETEEESGGSRRIGDLRTPPGGRRAAGRAVSARIPARPEPGTIRSRRPTVQQLTLLLRFWPPSRGALVLAGRSVGGAGRGVPPRSRARRLGGRAVRAPGALGRSRPLAARGLDRLRERAVRDGRERRDLVRRVRAPAAPPPRAPPPRAPFVSVSARRPRARRRPPLAPAGALRTLRRLSTVGAISAAAAPRRPAGRDWRAARRAGGPALQRATARSCSAGGSAAGSRPAGPPAARQQTGEGGEPGAVAVEELTALVLHHRRSSRCGGTPARAPRPSPPTKVAEEQVGGAVNPEVDENRPLPPARRRRAPAPRRPRGRRRAGR